MATTTTGIRTRARTRVSPKLGMFWRWGICLFWQNGKLPVKTGRGVR
jgi:hypothetical protein